VSTCLVGVSASSLFLSHSIFTYKRRLFPLLQNMKEMAAYLMLVLGGNESPTADDVTKALSSVGVEPDSAQLSSLISELEGKDLNEVLASGTELLAKFGSGGGGGGGGGGGDGGGGGGGAAAAVKEVEEEVEEAPPAVDMFGGGDGGGDY
jgi:large subunit ribosomal protein LP2